MGIIFVPEYESLDYEAHLDETQTGGVKHNRETGQKTSIHLFGQMTPRLTATEPETTMANDLLESNPDIQAAAAISDGCELDLTFGVPVEEKPIWVDLYESIRDVFFPPKLPPLELTSAPIPVPDRMAVKRNPWAFGISATINIGLATLAVFMGVRTYINSVKPKLQTTTIDVTEFKAPKADVSAGGGGGSPDKMEAIKGRIPPRAAAIESPKLDQPPTPTIDVQANIIIPDNQSLPNFGVSNSANVKLASGGNGSGLGVGNGHGNGYGPGDGGNIGGGLERIGGQVSAPVLIYHVDAEFTEEARKNKYQGIVVIEIIIDKQGNPQNPRVVRALGMGLDEKAIEAIKQYRFKPAMKNGKPVSVKMPVEIDFHIY
jgi:protein TonB